MADMIDREELKKAVDTWDRFYYVPLQGVKRGSNDDYTALVRINDILHCIDTMPTADVHPIKHGRWIHQGDDMWLCSNCKENIIFSMHESDRTEKQRYCCKCGARMDGEQNDT